jgi:hypothetical protein
MAAGEKIVAQVGQDAEQLRSLGYTSHFDRRANVVRKLGLAARFLCDANGLITPDRRS